MFECMRAAGPEYFDTGGGVKYVQDSISSFMR